MSLNQSDDDMSGNPPEKVTQSFTWRPISEYPAVVGDDLGPLVLARDKEKRPMLVLLREGHFYICPAVPIFYGDKQFGCMTADHVVEFMEVPK